MSVVIRLQNLPLTANASDIRTYFQGLRIPDGAVHIVGGEDGDVFIIFASDEDARQAMKRDRGRIHGAEIRLLLSSKTEMSEIVERAKAGLLPKKPSPPPPRVTQQEPAWQSPGQSVNPYAAPTNGDYSKPAYMRTAAPVVSEPAPPARYSPPRAVEPEPKYPRTAPGRLNDDYPPNSYRGAPPPERGYRGGPPERGYPPRDARDYKPYEADGYRRSSLDDVRDRRLPPVREPYGAPRIEKRMEDLAVHDKYPAAPDYRQEPDIHDLLSKLPPHLRPPHGIPPPHLRHLLPEFNGARAPEPRRSPPPAAPAPAPYRRGPSPPRSVPVRNESWRDTPATAPEKPWSSSYEPPRAAPARPPSVAGRKKGPLLGPPASAPVGNAYEAAPAPFGDARGPQAGFRGAPISRYIELSRLPSDMLRPSVLEDFIKPSVPLTLSSVRIVYSPQGVHMHTLVRLDSDADASHLLARDGEQGIKVRPTTKAIFDEAPEAPLAGATVGLAPLPPVASRFDRDRDRRRSPDDRRRFRRSRSRSPRRRRRSRSPPRRDRRRRTRSRTPPKRGRQEPDRWCLMLMNVPFRISEEEFRGWFAERVKPKKLTRAYYADGNASDRWVAEFESESLMERAKGIRALLNGRSIRMSYIDNDYADNILSIEDKYGEEKKNENEIKQLAEIQLQKLNQMEKENQMKAASSEGLPMEVMDHPKSEAEEKPDLAAAPTSLPTLASIKVSPQAPRSAPLRGRGGPVPNLGRPSFFPAPPARHGPPGAPPPMMNHTFFRGAPMRGRGRGAPFGFRPPPMLYGHMPGGPLGPDVNGHSEASETAEGDIRVDPGLVQSLGTPGCVIACNGFPPDITLQDIVSFFSDYNVDENSVRIRLGEGDAPTGECLLAVDSPEGAKAAVDALNGKSLRGHIVSLSVPKT